MAVIDTSTELIKWGYNVNKDKGVSEVYYSSDYVMQREAEFFNMWVVRCRSDNKYIDRGDNRHDLADIYNIEVS